MNKHHHHTNNAVLDAASGREHGVRTGDALAITRTECAGLPALVSYWKPSANELAILASGGSIALWVVGSTMPLVMLAVDPQ
jgi:hypothetical protein